MGSQAEEWTNNGSEWCGQDGKTMFQPLGRRKQKDERYGVVTAVCSDE